MSFYVLCPKKDPRSTFTPYGKITKKDIFFVIVVDLQCIVEAVLNIVFFKSIKPNNL